MTLTKLVKNATTGEETTVPLTPEEESEIRARQQASEGVESARNTALAQVVALAQSAVGVRVQDLTAAQRNAILVAMAWKAGALDNALVVRPLADWLR